MSSRTSALRGFALVALSTLGFAACESKGGTNVIITTPATISVSPAGPVTLAGPVAPATTGQSIVLSANTTGLTAVTFTCSTPAATDAVVSISGTNPCTVTAKAPGTTTVTIKATGTNGDAGTVSVSQGVQIIVTGSGGPPVTGSPTVTIQSITNQAGGNVDVTNANGQINVALNVDIPAGVQASKIRVLVDGTTACEQAITGATTGAAISTEGAEIPVTVVCSIPTNALGGSITCPNTPVNSVCFFNGSHVIKAQIIFTDATGDHIIASAADFPIILNNANFIAATITYSGVNGGPACTNSTAAGVGPAGALWCGGSVTVKATPAIYTAGGNTGVNGLQSSVVSITTGGTGVSGGAGCNVVQTAAINSATNGTIAARDRFGAVGTEAALPFCAPVTTTQSGVLATDGSFTATFPYATAPGTNGGVAGIEDNITVNIASLTNAGQVGPVCINPNNSTNPQNGVTSGGLILTCGNGFSTAFGGAVQRLDNLAPRVVVFDVTTGKLGCDVGTSPVGCYVSSPTQITSGFKMVDYGVDSPTAAFSFGSTGANSPLPSAFALTDQTTTSTSDFASVVVVDKLGNTSAPRFASTTFTTTVVSSSAAGAQPLGIDIEAPQCSFAPSSVGANSINPDPATGAFTLQIIDIATPPAGPSGFSTLPVLTSVTLLQPSGTTCVIGTNPGCVAVQSATSTTFNDAAHGGPRQGYFTITDNVVDQAGNTCGPLTRTTLYDVTAPVVGSISEPSIIQPGNNAVSFTGDLHDNVDLGTLNATLEYGAVIPQLQKAINVTISTFGPPLVTDVTGTYTDPSFVRSVETVNGGNMPSGAVTNADQVTFRVTDVAGNLTTRNESIVASVNAGGSFGSFAANNPALQTWTTAVTNGATFCNGVGTCVNPTSANIRSQVTGPALTFAVPFTRVEWYATNPSGVSVKIGEQAGNTAIGSDNTIINVRTWTFTSSWSTLGRAAGSYGIFALGIDSQGRALQSNIVNVTVSNT